ncbi:beta-ketoacyl-ACP synthase III [Solwaraspora sp. WMMD792]|uniref:beta-ketoacyl-ACP synthase III n=1 Tax=Solwaraspora sp. WMMD792 TaxID=3016099 RepID=UPI0024176F22|nr:beta-ketoacyl-ACP synthase III [Solwaraspora sp. WMMD792]MDG4773670.1 ketoacyl-ACP synthase III [Solwaraspora sp. WMMD792]
MTGSRILSVGHYQPSRILTNADLSKMVDTSDEWIQSRVGIQTRHIAEPDETVDEMAAHAARKALAQSGLSPADIDYVSVATCTAIDRSPNMAARVAARLGLSHPAVIDVNVACTGFTYALAATDHAVRAGAARNAIVVGVEKLSDFADWTDRTTCVLVGDGAGAVVLTAADQPGIGPVVWGSVPEMSDAVRIEGRAGTFQQAGQAVYRWATTVLPTIARQVCERAGVAPADLAAIVPHQANLRIIRSLAERIGAPNAIVAEDVVESGNTSAGSIPIALSKLVMRGDIPSGAPILLFGFGGGLSYGGQVVRCP